MEEYIKIPKEALDNFIIRLKEIDSLKDKIGIIQKSIGLTPEAQSKKDKAVRVSKKLFERYKKKLENNIKNSNGQYTLTKCGVVPAPVGFGNPTPSKSIAFDYVANYPNYTSGFGALFGLILDDPQALVVTLQMINDVLYTCTQAATWYTTGAWPEWSQDVITYNGGYMKGFTVRYNGVLYQSLVDFNVALPVNGSLLDFSNWIISPLEFPTNTIIYTNTIKQKNGFIIANGATLSKTTYRNLWLTAFNDNAVTDATTWQNGYYGLFADLGGDNFRIPDLRGFYLRTANQGSGHDPRRLGDQIGNYAQGLLLSHPHPATAYQEIHHHTYKLCGKFVAANAEPTGGQSFPEYDESYYATNDQQPNVYVNVQNNAGGSNENSVNDIALVAQLKY